MGRNRSRGNVAAAVRAANQECAVYVYPGSAHLFADEEFADYDQESSEAMIARFLEFLDQFDNDASENTRS